MLKERLIQQYNETRFGHKILLKTANFKKPCRTIVRFFGGILAVIAAFFSKKGRIEQELNQLEKDEFLFHFKKNKQTITFYLPLVRSDFIQKEIFMTETFYEENELRQCRKLVKTLGPGNYIYQ